LSLKTQIPSTKLQKNPLAIARHERAGLKFQYPITKTFKNEILVGVSNFEHWDLIFVISLS